MLRPFDTRPVRREWKECGHVLENAVLLAEAVVIRGRRNILLNGPCAFADPVDPIGAGIGKRADQNRIRHAEDCRVRADTDGQRGGGGERQEAIAAQTAQSVADIFEKVLDHSGPPGVAALLLPLGWMAELTQRGGVRLNRLHACRDVLLNLEVEVKAQLFVEFPLHGVTPK